MTYKLIMDEDLEGGTIISAVNGVTKTRRVELKCNKCEMQHCLVVDHIIPRIWGGDDIDNLQVLCTGCNTRKGNKEDKEYHRKQYRILNLRGTFSCLLSYFREGIEKELAPFLDEVKQIRVDYSDDEIYSAIHEVEKSESIEHIDKLRGLLNLSNTN